MRYSYKFKRDAVDLYRQGKWPETPEGIKPGNFHIKVRLWARIEEELGLEALKHPKTKTLKLYYKSSKNYPFFYRFLLQYYLTYIILLL